MESRFEYQSIPIPAPVLIQKLWLWCSYVILKIDPFIGKTEEVFSGMPLSTSSSESSVERTESVSPALTIEKLTGKPTEARDVEEMTTLTRLETDVTKSDKDVTRVHLTHSTLNVEVVTVSKWPGDEDNSTSKPLPSTEHAGFTKLPPVPLSTIGINGKDKEIPSFTDGGGEYTLFPDGTPKPLEKVSEEDLASGELTVTFHTSTSIGSAEKSASGEPTTGDRFLPTTSTEDQVINATAEGSALGEDTEASKPLFTGPPFVHTSDVEELAFVNYSSTQEPTTYVDISHTSPLSIIPKTEWSVLETSVPLEDEILGKSDRSSHKLVSCFVLLSVILDRSLCALCKAVIIQSCVALLQGRYLSSLYI